MKGVGTDATFRPVLLMILIMAMHTGNNDRKYFVIKLKIQSDCRRKPYAIVKTEYNLTDVPGYTAHTLPRIGYYYRSHGRKGADTIAPGNTGVVPLARFDTVHKDVPEISPVTYPRELANNEHRASLVAWRSEAR